MSSAIFKKTPHAMALSKPLGWNSLYMTLKWGTRGVNNIIARDARRISKVIH